MEIADKTFLIDAETRVINIPDGEEHLGVKGDVGTGHKYFKCPRIVGDDRIDLNEHQIYISYVKTNTAKATRFVGDPALYHCNDVALDETISIHAPARGATAKLHTFAIFFQGIM